MATLLLPAPSISGNSNAVTTLKTQAAEARIALELVDFKARLDRITANFNIDIAALEECQTFAPRSHKGAIIKPKRQRLTGRRRAKTNAEHLKALATPLIEKMAAISVEFQHDNTASNAFNGSNNTPSTVDTANDTSEHVNTSSGVVDFNNPPPILTLTPERKTKLLQATPSKTAKKASSAAPSTVFNSAALAVDSIIQSIKFGLIAALAVFAHFNPSTVVTDTALALASVFMVELTIKMVWLYAALSKAKELKGGDAGEITPPEVKRLNKQPYNSLARAKARKSAGAIRERRAAPS